MTRETAEQATRRIVAGFLERNQLEIVRAVLRKRIAKQMERT